MDVYNDLGAKSATAFMAASRPIVGLIRARKVFP